MLKVINYNYSGKWICSTKQLRCYSVDRYHLTLKFYFSPNLQPYFLLFCLGIDLSI